MLGEKRMFSRKVVESDAFLDMPATAQMLYFHLCLNADDEGFISAPKRVMRMVGASEKDLKALADLRFILGFESGVVVIKHWWLNNTKRKDRLQPTDYAEEKALLFMKDNGAYTFTKSHDNQVSTTCQPEGNQMTPQNKIKENKIKQNKRKESGEGETDLIGKLLKDISDKVNSDAV